MVSPLILFGHLKYGLFFIFSRIWCLGSLNAMLTTWAVAGPVGPAKSLLGRLLLYLSNLKSLRSWGNNFAFPFPCCWSFSTYLYLLIRSISLRTLRAGFLVKDFLKSCSAGRSTLNILIATSSQLSSISLNISQYLSKYVFRVSPSLIAIDSKESRWRVTLLQVTNWAPKTLVSSWKELIDHSSNPSNHLIAIGPKLDGNTLHINASFFEWTTILWLNWLTCSNGSVLPLYMVNVG